MPITILLKNDGTYLTLMLVGIEYCQYLQPISVLIKVRNDLILPLAVLSINTIGGGAFFHHLFV